MHTNKRFLRRNEAGGFLKNKYGHGSAKTLAKLASTGGGPEMVYAGRIPFYTPEALDEWALAKLSKPVSSTSQRPAKVV
jgi:hypothetical protein